MPCLARPVPLRAAVQLSHTHRTRHHEVQFTACHTPLRPSHSCLPHPFRCAAGNDVGVNDAVDVVDGPLKGRSGTVRYIMRGFLFIQTREVAENAGFICLQARHTKVRGAAWARMAPPRVQTREGTY